MIFQLGSAVRHKYAERLIGTVIGCGNNGKILVSSGGIVFAFRECDLEYFDGVV